MSFCCVRYPPAAPTLWPGSRFTADITADPGTTGRDLRAAEALRLVSTRRRSQIIEEQIQIYDTLQVMSDETAQWVLDRTIDGVEQWYHFEHAANPDTFHIHGNDEEMHDRHTRLRSLRTRSRLLHGEILTMRTLQMAVRSEYRTRSDSASCHLYV